MAPARTYWLETSNLDGSPHATPVWGIVLDDRFYIYSERTTPKSRNLAQDCRAVIHLEGGEEVVIVHGTFDDLGPPGELPGVIKALSSKYDAMEDALTPNGNQHGVAVVLGP